MSESKLIELGYYDPSAKIRLSAYADTVVLDADKKGSVICAIRFGGYPEMVRAMADAIYGGATIEATQNDMVRKLQSKLKGYQRQITHDGVRALLPIRSLRILRGLLTSYPRRLCWIVISTPAPCVQCQPVTARPAA